MYQTTRRWKSLAISFALLLAILSAVLVAGCGGDDDGEAPTAASTSASKATEAKPATAVSAAATVAASPTTAASVLDGTWTGTWKASASADNGTVRIQWKQTGAQLAGTIVVTNTPCVTNGTITGQVNGNAITFGAVQSATTIAYTGTLSGSTITGTYKADASCGNATGSWSATKG